MTASEFDADVVMCPNCLLRSSIHPTAVRQVKERPGLVDVAWRCIECKKEWGFEVLTDDNIEKLKLTLI